MPIRNALVGLFALALGAAVGAQVTVIRSPASQFPMAQYETNGSNSAPSVTWVSSLTTGFYYTGTSGQIGVDGALIPGTASTYDLGSSGNPWRNLYISGTFGVGSVGFGDGSSGAPSIFFTSAATLGLYKAGATAIGSTGTFQAASGSAGAPTYSFASATGVGFYWVSGTIIGETGSIQPSATATYALGATGSRFTTGWFSGNVTEAAALVGDGTSGAPSMAFSSTTTLGFYRNGATIGVTGPMLPSSDNAFDFGTNASANAWRNGFFKSQVWAQTVQIGANATASNNGAIRSEYTASGGTCCAGMLGLILGDGSAFGDWRLRRLAAGTGGGDPSFTSLNGSDTFWNLLDQESTVPTEQYQTFMDNSILTYTANMAQNFATFQGQLYIEPLHNFTKTGAGVLAGVYGVAFADGFDTSVATPGTLQELDGVVGDAEFGGNGTVQALFSWAGVLGTYAPFSGTLGVVAQTGFLHLGQPFQGAVNATKHTAIWIEDQTSGGAYTPVSNYWLEVDVAGGLHNTLGTASGLLGLWGATPTATAPLRIGATFAGTRFDNGNSGTALTVDLSKGNAEKITLTGNVTLTLTNPTDSGVYNIEIFTGTGGFTVTWPASVKWPGGTAPTITVTASRMDLIRLVYDSTSGEYWGSFVQNITP